MIKRGQGLFITTGVISLALVTGRILGYAVQALLAAKFGVSHVTDAYLVAQDIPASTAIAAGLIMVLVPIYRDVLHNRGKAAAEQLVSLVLAAAMLFLGVLVAIGWVLAPKIIGLVAPGLSADAHSLAVSLFRILLPTLAFTGTAGVLSGVLNAQRHFTLPAAMPLIGNAVVVMTLVTVSRAEQIHWVAAAVSVGALLGAVLQLVRLRTAGFSFRLPSAAQVPALTQVAWLVFPAIVTIGVTQVHNTVDRFVASSLPEGTIAALTYALLISALPYGVLGSAISTSIYPTLAEHAAVGERTALQQTCLNGLEMLSFVLVPMAVGVLIFGQAMVTLLFQHGAFTPAATLMTTYALRFYAPGILFIACADLLNRVFFSLKDTRTPMLAGLFALALHLALDMVLVRYLAQGGLALGATIAWVCTLAFLLWRLRAAVGTIRFGPAVRSAGMDLVTSCVGGVVGYGAYWAMARVFPGLGFAHQALQLMAGCGTLVGIHIGLALLFGHSQAAALRRSFGTLLGQSTSPLA